MLRVAVVFAGLSVLALGGCGQSESDTGAGDTATAIVTPAATVAAAPAGTAGEKPAAFLVCGSCHAVEAGKNGVGPSLAGVVGRKAASVAGFAYSDALKASNLTWDEATLDAFLAAPTKVAPGTRMVMAVPDAAQRKAIIDYLATFK